MASLANSADTDEEEGQAFYAGGSERRCYDNLKETKMEGKFTYASNPDYIGLYGDPTFQGSKKAGGLNAIFYTGAFKAKGDKNYRKKKSSFPIQYGKTPNSPTSNMILKQRNKKRNVSTQLSNDGYKRLSSHITPNIKNIFFPLSDFEKTDKLEAYENKKEDYLIPEKSPYSLLEHTKSSDTYTEESTPHINKSAAELQNEQSLNELEEKFINQFTPFMKKVPQDHGVCRTPCGPQVPRTGPSRLRSASNGE